MGTRVRRCNNFKYFDTNNNRTEEEKELDSKRLKGRVNTRNSVRLSENGPKTKLAKQLDFLRQLQIENAELKMENEMLKKAAAYFAKNLK